MRLLIIKLINTWITIFDIKGEDREKHVSFRHTLNHDTSLSPHEHFYHLVCERKLSKRLWSSLLTKLNYVAQKRRSSNWLKLNVWSAISHKSFSSEIFLEVTKIHWSVKTDPICATKLDNCAIIRIEVTRKIIVFIFCWILLNIFPRPRPRNLIASRQLPT